MFWHNGLTFGNGSSWIGNSANSFVGLKFATTAVPLGSVAWGRSNVAGGDPCGPGVCLDRTAGVYTLAYTQVANPGVALPFTGNATTGRANIGPVNYIFQGIASPGSPVSPVSMSLRHLWSFPSVTATGIRLTTAADGTPVDELEASAASAAPFSLVPTGGIMGPGNIGLDSAAFARDLINNGGYAAHQIPNLNDGIYGNGSHRHRPAYYRQQWGGDRRI